MHCQSSRFTVFLLLLTGLAKAAANDCRSNDISVRIPPYLNPALNMSSSFNRSRPWKAPSTNSVTGAWYMTNSSAASLRRLLNLEWDFWPVIPSCTGNTTSCSPGTSPGSMFELTSWNIQDGNSSVAQNAYGFGGSSRDGRSVSSLAAHDVPRRFNQPELGEEWNAVYDTIVTQGSPAGYSASWSIVYWGEDAQQVPFFIMHETGGSIGGSEARAKSPSAVEVVSRSTFGPDEASLTAVLKALETLNCQELTDLVNALGPVSWDHSLSEGPVVCGETCQNNEQGSSVVCRQKSNI